MEADADIDKCFQSAGKTVELHLLQILQGMDIITSPDRKQKYEIRLHFP